MTSWLQPPLPAGLHCLPVGQSYCKYMPFSPRRLAPHDVCERTYHRCSGRYSCCKEVHEFGHRAVSGRLGNPTGLSGNQAECQWSAAVTRTAADAGRGCGAGGIWRGGGSAGAGIQLSALVRRCAGVVCQIHPVAVDLGALHPAGRHLRTDGVARKRSIATSNHVHGASPLSQNPNYICNW